MCKKWDSKTDWVVRNHGVPQGTVLGPSIFILHLNDFSEAASTNCGILKFADDKAIQFHAKNEANLHLICEDTLNKTDQNMKQNRLILNEEKNGVNGFQE